MISIDFGGGLEWWVQNVVYRGITDSITVADERDENVKLRLREVFGTGGIDLTTRDPGTRAALIEGLIRGVDGRIAAVERDGDTGDGALDHLRLLRATAERARDRREPVS